MALFGFTFIFFMFMVLALALGLLFGRRAIKGSCGGLSSIPGLEDACGACAKKTCPKKRKALQQKQVLET